MMDLSWFNCPEASKTAWEKAWPTRLIWEIEELNDHGRVVHVDRRGAAVGVLGIHYDWHDAGETRRLLISYPPGFPNARPDVHLTGDRRLFPRRHCDPVNGMMCYLGHDRHAWNPEDSIAKLIASQLPGILAGTAVEEAVGEPAENWWAYGSKGDSVLVIDSAWMLGDATSGTLSVRIVARPEREPIFRCLVERVADQAGATIATWSIALPLEFASAAMTTMPWVRFDEEIMPVDEMSVAKTMLEHANGCRRYTLRPGQYAKFVVAVFPTELVHGEQGWSWVLFAFSGDERAFKAQDLTKLGRNTPKTLRAGNDDRRRRAPSANALVGRNIVIAGIGAIGAPIALELARNKVGSLTLVDEDIVKPGNAVRWPFGESAWGQSKAEVLRHEIARMDAGVKVDIVIAMIERLALDRDGPGAALRRAIENADLVVDATTSFSASMILAETCSAAGVALMSVNATPTLEGGAVAIFAPASACPLCLVNRQLGTSPDVPKPPGDDGDPQTVKLPGCAEATFAGSSYDLAELSIEAVRVAARELKAQSPRSFVETLSFVGPERLPCWRIDGFDPHPACGCR